DLRLSWAISAIRLRTPSGCAVAASSTVRGDCAGAGATEFVITRRSTREPSPVVVRRVTSNAVVGGTRRAVPVSLPELDTNGFRLGSDLAEGEVPVLRESPANLALNGLRRSQQEKLRQDRQAGGHWFEPSSAHFCCRFDNVLGICVAGSGRPGRC